MSEPQVLTARFIFPVDQPPLEHGTITIVADKIVAVEPAGSRSADIDFGNSGIIPGLVNVHTHLDLSGLRGKVPPSADFTGWLKSIIAHRRSQTPEQIQSDIRTGLDESLRYGTTLIGDISAEGMSWTALSEAGAWSVVFHELIGLSQGRAAQQLSTITEWIRARPALEHCRAGISPHAPYSVHRSIFQNIAKTTSPVAIHVAESKAELDLLANHEGPIVVFLKELAIWDPDSLSRDYDNIVRDYSSPTLFVHANYLSGRMQIPRNGTIVYCPRTHAAFGHSPHPFQDFLGAGTRIVLATDSLASNPDLDVLAEARFVHEHNPTIPGDVLLRMITLSGAEALGWECTTGSLTPGKSAELVIVPLRDKELTDPHMLLFERDSLQESRRTMWRGNWRIETTQNGKKNDLSQKTKT